MVPSEHEDEVLDSIPVTVRHLRYQKGDVLHIALGGDLGDGMPPWIPTQDDIDKTKAFWDTAVPDYVRVVVTHCLEVPTIIYTGQAE